MLLSSRLLLLRSNTMTTMAMSTARRLLVVMVGTGSVAPSWRPNSSMRILKLSKITHNLPKMTIIVHHPKQSRSNLKEVK